LGKLILVSIILATVVIPAIGARDASPRRGLARALIALVVFDVLYLLALTQLYAPNYVPEKW